MPVHTLDQATGLHMVQHGSTMSCAKEETDVKEEAVPELVTAVGGIVNGTPK